MTATLEHTNFTASDCRKTAAWLCEVFGWHIRWQGNAIAGGYTVHVGSDDSYLAVYTPADPPREGSDNYTSIGGLNHIGVLVDDLDATQDRVKAAGFTPFNHADYEPGRRFYFLDHDGTEFEVISYAS